MGLLAVFLRSWLRACWETHRQLQILKGQLWREGWEGTVPSSIMFHEFVKWYQTIHSTQRNCQQQLRMTFHLLFTKSFVARNSRGAFGEPVIQDVWFEQGINRAAAPSMLSSVGRIDKLFGMPAWTTFLCFAQLALALARKPSLPLSCFQPSTSTCWKLKQRYYHVLSIYGTVYYTNAQVVRRKGDPAWNLYCPSHVIIARSYILHKFIYPKWNMKIKSSGFGRNSQLFLLRSFVAAFWATQSGGGQRSNGGKLRTPAKRQELPVGSWKNVTRYGKLEGHLLNLQDLQAFQSEFITKLVG